MSRLESFIRRLEAQRTCIDFAARPGNLPKGPIFALGFGNGRTYDHLRTVFPSREIYVFDRRVASPPDCVPDSRHLFFGEMDETLPRVAPRFRDQVALVHVDVGHDDEAIDDVTAMVLASLIREIAAPQALVASNHPIPLPEWQPVTLFELPKHRYSLYRNAQARSARDVVGNSRKLVPNIAPAPSYAVA